MKTLLSIVLIFCIGLGISSNAYAYRTPKPIPIRGTEPPDLVELNTVLEELWNVTNGRYEEFDERIIFTPLVTKDITAIGGITAAKILIRVQGSGGAVDITANPQITDGIDGQIILLQGDSDTNTVKFDDGTGLQLAGAVSFTMGKGDILQLVYDSGDDLWIEITRSDN